MYFVLHKQKNARYSTCRGNTLRGKVSVSLAFSSWRERESVEGISTRELRDLRGTTLLHYNLCEQLRLINCYHLCSHQSGTDKPLMERKGFAFGLSQCRASCRPPRSSVYTSRSKPWLWLARHCLCDTFALSTRPKSA